MAKPKVLLVDDTKLVLELEKGFLRPSDIEVVTASNGAEALDLIRQDPPNLVFMDMHMPVMDGITCCSQLKADPFLSEIPVIMLTTAGKDADRERAFAAGCNNYLTKPIDRRLFLETARKYTEAIDRREPRIRCHIPVLLVHDDKSIAGHALDISRGGIFLATHEVMPQQTPLKLAFYLPGASSRLLEVAGTVAWVNEEGKRIHAALPAGAGVQFLDLGDEARAALKAFLETEQRTLAGRRTR